ncbi:Hypothetical predicted protein [Pelobates cultripes]|uniref:Uncharacterized protein n=1 Tax=Pelobates cultripes TaxID=61616 RepID=A0AAD1RYZ8_PELCU|nr:Hypothetical predicted protein [Pelobates cultripes]
MRGLPETVTNDQLQAALIDLFKKILPEAPLQDLMMDRAHRALRPLALDPDTPRDAIGPKRKLPEIPRDHQPLTPTHAEKESTSEISEWQSAPALTFGHKTHQRPSPPQDYQKTNKLSDPRQYPFLSHSIL